jgi:hypothetical protein
MRWVFVMKLGFFAHIAEYPDSTDTLARRLEIR